MKIVILTGQQPHHKHLCGCIAQRHEVVGVVHPRADSSGGARKALRSAIRSHGWLYAALNAGAKLPAAISGWNVAAANAHAETVYFPDAEQDYARINRDRIFAGLDVNAPEGIGCIRDLAPDVVINLGGAIYREELIRSCGLFLNYHSGLSPIYNGAGTVNFAFANGHPHLCGGTLMTMSPVIDGGAVLGHYLPSVVTEDTPASLNMKTYAGAAVLYHRFLTDLENGISWSGIPQSQPMFYIRGVHWTLYQTLMTAYHLRRETAGRHLREEKIVEYWKQTDDAAAERLLNRSLAQLLWGRV